MDESAGPDEICRLIDGQIDDPVHAAVAPEDAIVEKGRLRALDKTVLKKNRAVHELGVIAYAGVPMTAPTGERIGAFCGIDTEPHAWTERDYALLSDFVDVLGGLGVLRPVDRNANGDRSEGTWDPTDVTRVLMKGIAAATRILRGEAARLEEAEREQLLSALDRQTGRLSQAIGERQAFQEAGDGVDPRTA